MILFGFLFKNNLYFNKLNTYSVPPVLDGITGKIETLPPQKCQRYRCKLDTMQDIRREMAKVYREARSGLIDVQDATKLTWCLQAVGKTIEGSDLEKRIEALENMQ